MMEQQRRKPATGAETETHPWLWLCWWQEVHYALADVIRGSLTLTGRHGNRATGLLEGERASLDALRQPGTSGCRRSRPRCRAGPTHYCSIGQFAAGRGGKSAAILARRRNLLCRHDLVLQVFTHLTQQVVVGRVIPEGLGLVWLRLDLLGTGRLGPDSGQQLIIFQEVVRFLVERWRLLECPGGGGRPDGTRLMGQTGFLLSPPRLDWHWREPVLLGPLSVHPDGAVWIRPQGSCRWP